MIYLWLNSNILLLGYELNASLNRLRKINKSDESSKNTPEMIFILSGSSPNTCPVLESRNVVKLKLRTTPSPKNSGPKRLFFSEEDATNGMRGKIQGDMRVNIPAKSALKYNPSLINIPVLRQRY